VEDNSEQRNQPVVWRMLGFITLLPFRIMGRLVAYTWQYLDHPKMSLFLLGLAVVGFALLALSPVGIFTLPTITALGVMGTWGVAFAIAAVVFVVAFAVVDSVARNWAIWWLNRYVISEWGGLSDKQPVGPNVIDEGDAAGDKQPTTYDQLVERLYIAKIDVLWWVAGKPARIVEPSSAGKSWREAKPGAMLRYQYFPPVLRAALNGDTPSEVLEAAIDCLFPRPDSSDPS